MIRRICVVTGSRAEYGILYWVLHDLRAAPGVELQLVVTGAHLSPEFGHTVRDIEADGFVIAARVEMLLSSDSPDGIAKSMGLGVMGMSSAFVQLRPDIVVVLGDRYEILAAVQAALIHTIPVAHIGGGDVTEGAIDESIRHAITKIAHLHFVTNDLSAGRVRQMGEDPANVHVVGSPALDHLRRSTLLDRETLEAALGAPLGPRNVLVTFHPVTLEPEAMLTQFDALLDALDTLSGDIRVWFTRSNADAGGRAMSARLDDWALDRSDRVNVYASLGQRRYLSLMAHVDAVIGNSSSGLYEAPSFSVPTVDIGDRQKGRIAAPSVLHCEPERIAIAHTIERALAMRSGDVVNPYGDGRSASRIVDVLRRASLGPDLLKKRFHTFNGTV